MDSKRVVVIGGHSAIHQAALASVFSHYTPSIEFLEDDTDMFLRISPRKTMPIIDTWDFSVPKVKTAPSPTEIKLVKLNGIGRGYFAFNSDGSKCFDSSAFFICRANTEVQAKKKFDNFKRNQRNPDEINIETNER